MESLSEWDHFTSLNKRKTNTARLSTLTAPPAARESLSRHRRGGRVERDLPCQGQLQSDKTQLSVHPDCCSCAPQTTQASPGARAGLAWVPSLQHSAGCSDIHTELGWLKSWRVGLNDFFLYSDQSPHLIHYTATEMLVPGSLRTAKQVREGRAALISKTAGLKAAWNTETEDKIANLRTKLWTCCLTHNWLEMNAEQSRTLARWCNLLCFLHLFPYAQFWLIAVATMFLKLKSLTKKKKKRNLQILIIIQHC